MTAKFTPFENTGKHLSHAAENINPVPLFQEYGIKSLTLKNRIVVPPMCTYSSENGLADDFHISHYGSLGRGGAALVIVEATAVSPEGRITPSCLGIWNDAQAKKLEQVASAIKSGGAIPGIQLGHAGRKASANEPWNGDEHIVAGNEKAWDTIAPSAVPFGEHLSRIPLEMTTADIRRVQNDFKDAALRARNAGFEWLELHFAHGYLAQSFFSVHSNKRSDEYGIDFEGRSRFLLETVALVREVWPEQYPLTIRFGVLEYDGNDEATLQESVKLITLLKDKGLDLLDVSVGFTVPGMNVPWGKAFLVEVARQMRNAAKIPVASAWGLGDPEAANDAVASGAMDLVMIGRGFLANPFYTFEIAKKLSKENPSWVLPTPYAHWLERYR
ncbi:NADH:flavin oxidoreductase/NADH oxidase [Pectobacterium aroidearum]|uniref:NADH:flavin oxidoreductase/NADH oxidase n=1 Tax=Pectobacterium aroidearum TaxID=1201031 RepID=UPI002A839EE8|nr:NADH:flavin oxidoreductase/NADH oxidase [Pectobacterium aroidearum]MDY4388696.1 NADH:flavin oxidoreductase/NADH oxidase [Pectobacterium aroidearum]